MHDVLVMRGSENSTNDYDLLEIVKVAPRSQVEYPADLFPGDLGPYETSSTC